MLQYTAGGSDSRLCVFTHHSDRVREWAYDRKSQIGRLDKDFDEAGAKGRALVDMKDDWRQMHQE